MSASTLYFDWNATAPLLPAAKAAALRAMESGGNPSAVHGAGRAARSIVEDAREAVAHAVGAQAAQIVFTSGATEANNLAIAGLKTVAGHILVSAIEHPSVIEPVRASGLPFDILPATPDGIVDVAALERRLDALAGRIEGMPLIAVMAANNETGVVQPLARIVALARAKGALVHCDAVQMLGKAALDFETLGADTMTLSAHKIGALPGAGALVTRADIPLAAQLRGGGQERRRRAGTENLPGIASFGAAAREAVARIGEWARVEALRDRLEAALGEIAPAAVVFGAAAPRLPNTSAFATPGLASQVQVMAFDLEGIAVSAGAACSSGKIARSPVLEAMGAGALAGEAVRVSLGRDTREEDIARFLDVYAHIVASRARAQRAPAMLGA